MKKTLLLAAGCAALIGTPAGAQTPAVGDYLGEVLIFAGNYCPRGYAFMDGQIVSIQSNTALYSLIGTAYGGDGRTSFALPDMRGRVAVGDGQGPGLTPRPLGQRWGEELTTLTEANMPSHTHGLFASTSPPDNTSPSNNAIATATTGPSGFTDAAPAQAFADGSVSEAGEGEPFDNRAPVLAITHCIATGGIYPPRN